jgi:ribonuclease HII
MAWLTDRLLKRKFLSAEEIHTTVGFRSIVGVSVDGLPAIAGPITASAVILVPEQQIKYNQRFINRLTPEECDQLADDIKYRADTATIGWGSVDQLAVSTQKALHYAVGLCLGLFSFYDPVTAIILDNFILDPPPINLERSGIPMISVRNAYEFVEPVIAARIVARSARNSFMNEAHQNYPEYDWKNNKGYATPQHIEAIKMYGITELHRPLEDVKSFKGVNLFRNIRERNAPDNIGR